MGGAAAGLGLALAVSARAAAQPTYICISAAVVMGVHTHSSSSSSSSGGGAMPVTETRLKETTVSATRPRATSRHARLRTDELQQHKTHRGVVFVRGALAAPAAVPLADRTGLGLAVR
eukprot:COSAG05_NODE_639_length_8156_cov_122.162840_4_plen_118_part_00